MIWEPGDELGHLQQLLEVSKLVTRLPDPQPRSNALIEAHRACSNRTRVLSACVQLFTLPVVQSRCHCDKGLAQQDGGATRGLSGWRGRQRTVRQMRWPTACLSHFYRQFGMAMIMPRLYSFEPSLTSVQSLQGWPIFILGKLSFLAHRTVDLYPCPDNRNTDIASSVLK